MSTGSLGQGLSPGVGMALGARVLGKDFRTWVMLGDGEIQEGQIWEAAFVASRYALDNLTAILDWNHLQQYGWATPQGYGTGARRDPVDSPKAKWLVVWMAGGGMRRPRHRRLLGGLLDRSLDAG